MLKWVKASYHDSQVQDKAELTTLKYIGTDGRYNVYQMLNGESIVVFSDQTELLELVNGSLGSVFLLRFLSPHNNKYTYTAELDGIKLTVITLARATVLIPGTLDNPRELSVGLFRSNVTIE